jgi:hypothetical protein
MINVPALAQLKRITGFLVFEDEDMRRDADGFIDALIDELQSVGYESSDFVETLTAEVKKSLDVYLISQGQEVKKEDQDEKDEKEVDEETLEDYAPPKKEKKARLARGDVDDEELDDYVSQG